MHEKFCQIYSVQDGKASGRDGISSKVWKHGGLKMTDCLYKLIQKIRATLNVSQDRKNASIVFLFRKGDQKECRNY